MTAYVVLRKMSPEEQGEWHWVQKPGTVEAISAEAAVRKVLGEDGAGGVFVAVPVRSFQELAATVETKRAVSIA